MKKEIYDEPPKYKRNKKSQTKKADRQHSDDLCIVSWIDICTDYRTAQNYFKENFDLRRRCSICGKFTLLDYKHYIKILGDRFYSSNLNFIEEFPELPLYKI